MEPTLWATYDDVVALCPTCAPMPNDPVMSMALTVSTEILYELTGRQWPGLATAIERPFWCICGLQPSACSCGWLSEVTLERGPVRSVQQVKVYGDIVDPARYRLDGGSRLVWQPDLDMSHPGFRWHSWPPCQMLDRPDTELWTWSVAYTYGRACPTGGKMAAATLACQYALAMTAPSDGGPGCRLPQRVTNIVRQGVSMVVLDPMTLVKDGMTGLAEVDLWVASILKGRERRGGAVLIPGRPHGRIIG